EHSPVVVGRSAAADVAGVSLARVEPPEDQAPMCGVERAEPLRRLEHDRVSLDQAALVAEAGSGVAVGGECLRRLGCCMQAGVDAGDHRLLVLYLLLARVVGLAAVLADWGCDVVLPLRSATN